MTLMMNFEGGCISNIGRGRTVWMASAHAGPAAVTGGQTRGVRIKKYKEHEKYKEHNKYKEHKKYKESKTYKEHKTYNEHKTYKEHQKYKERKKKYKKYKEHAAHTKQKGTKPKVFLFWCYSISYRDPHGIKSVSAALGQYYEGPCT